MSTAFYKMGLSPDLFSNLKLRIDVTVSSSLFTAGKQTIGFCEDPKSTHAERQNRRAKHFSTEQNWDWCEA